MAVRTRFVFLMLAVLACSTAVALAQQNTGDPLIDKRDNPTGRAEFERMKRADPATGQIPEGIRARELEFVARIPSREALSVRAHGEKGGPSLAASTIVWNERGPVNQGGRTRAIAADMDNEDVFLAGGISGGMWRSEDAGQTWVRVTEIDQLHSVTCLVQDPRPGARNVWYYGTGEFRANSANLSGDGIFKSVNGGKTWTQLESTSLNTPQSRDQMFDNVHRIVVDPSNLNQDEVYAACFGGIVRSTDGGESWDVVLGNFENTATYTDIDITSTGVLYATISSNGRNTEGIWRSEDGVNWVDITPQNFPTSYNKISVGIAPSNQNLVYFFGQTSGKGKNNHSLWVYQHGMGWEDRSQGLPGNVETYSSYCIVVRVKPDDEDMVFLGNVQCHRSTDGFRDSNNVPSHMGSGQHADQHEYFFFPSDPNRMLAGHDGGISLTQNADANRVTWESLNTGYVTTQFYSVAIDPVLEGSQTVIGGTQDNGTWFVNEEENLTEWRKIYGADGGFCAISDSGTDYYTSYQNGQMFRSQFTETGTRTSWTRIDPEGGSSYMFIHPFTLDQADTRIMYLPEGRNLWRNSNLTEIDLDRRGTKKDTNWEKLTNAQIPNNSGSISAVGTSRRNPVHRLYYGTSRGEVYRVDNANVGQPESENITEGSFPTGSVSCIAVDPYDGDKVIAVISNYNTHSLFYSENGGETWDIIGGNLEENANGTGNGPSVNWVAILPVEDNRVYFVGTTAGLYSTTFLNGMNTEWVQEGASTIGNVVVDMVQARESDGFVAVGTHGRGVYTANVLQSLIEATLTIEPISINFGDVEVSTTKLDTVTITNNSSSAREIRGSLGELASPFSVFSSDLDLQLAPGQSRQVVVQFTPEEVGGVSEPLQVRHDGTEPSPQFAIWLVGRGIPKSTTGVLAQEESPNVLPTLTSYPNPFQKSVGLRFTLQARDHVTIKALTANGVEVATLQDKVLEAGEHELKWNADNLASGVYYVRLQIGTAHTTTRVVLER